MNAIRLVLFVFAVSLVGAGSAHAGKALTSGPVLFGFDDNLICAAVNVSGKEVADVVVSIFKGEAGTAESNTSCVTEAPTGICGVTFSANSPGYRYCAVTLSGSTKSLRARLCNEDTGECSELR
jgi:hypothetical protein